MDTDLYNNSSDEEYGAYKHKTDEELFYNPKADAEDLAWIKSKYKPKKEGKGNGKEGAKGKKKTNERNENEEKEKHSTGANNGLEEGMGLHGPSDAVLNCPACFTEITRDCQRHEKYESQYRAMFVHNVRVCMNEVLSFQPSTAGHAQDRGWSIHATRTSSGAPETYYPAYCSRCGTELGVMDREEVYHFFNVFPGIV